MAEHVTVAKVHIELPGGQPIAGEIVILEGEPVKLDEIAIQVHSLVNDIVMSIRKNHIVKDGKDQV